MSESFWDWSSLFQDPRSPDELVKFENSLRNINVWYAHQSTMKILITCPASRCGMPPISTSAVGQHSKAMSPV